MPRKSHNSVALGLGVMLLGLGPLLLPAAYHRIVERGDDSEEFHNFAGRILLLAMFFLGLGLAGDIFIVVHKISGSSQLAAWLAIGLMMFFLLLWFGYTTWKRRAI